MKEFIVIKGAREHNLKNLSLNIPRDFIVVITGPSGSGKSSLAIDIIYAEGQRRYVQSLSNYARQFIGEMRKPDIDYIEGLSPSICIEQKTTIKSSRSTLGTITEIYDYMRVLYTYIGKPYCYKCGKPITVQETERILESLLNLPSGTKIQILSPIVRERKGEYKKQLQQMRREGFVRARIDGKMVELTDNIKLKRYKRHTIEIVIDRFIIKTGIQRQLKNSISSALKYSDTIVINLVDSKKDLYFSKKLACQYCGVNYPEISPMLFSFNSKLGACRHCNGLGYEGISDEEENIIIDKLVPCSYCKGYRLRKEATGIKIGGLHIGEFSALSVLDAQHFLKELKLNDRELIIASRILKEVEERLSFLEKVGLHYLTLNRPTATLSGGEAQRVRLATQLGSSLNGVLYVLDEPSIGLHPRDFNKLLNVLKQIKKQGNTVIVVEHEEEMIKNADYVIELGPGGGSMGGRIIAQGTPLEICQNEKSLTGQFLSGKKSIPLPRKRRIPKDYIKIIGASEHNLKNINVQIPLGIFVCVTGVSGSGKSTLVIDILYKALKNYLYKEKIEVGKYQRIEGLDKLTKVICVDQKPLGNTPRSNPATYTGIFKIIRELFSMTPQAKAKGFTPATFSFNLKGGRCEVCKGEGYKKVKMQLLPDVYVACDECDGKRYNKETLKIKFKGKNIADVLEMTATEAYQFFYNIPTLRQKLQKLIDVGLGYVKLGQPATTLSGGEAQRISLAKELSKNTKGNTLYIFVEPTTGLHFYDIEKLLHIFNELVEKGNTVIVIEHNLEIIKSADYIIDIGPEGGEKGGYIVAEGTPEEIADNNLSYTGYFLKDKLIKSVTKEQFSELIDLKR